MLVAEEKLITDMPNTALASIAEKVLSNRRLTPQEGLFLLETPESEAVREMADFARQARVGDEVLFSTTLFIHPTNLCELSCPMCSYYAKPGWKSAWFLSPEDVENKVRKHPGINEVHIVGGLWRDCDLNYYQDVFSRIKTVDPTIHIKALSPVEYDFLARHHNLSIEQVFEKMISFGLGSLPGGGAEILDEKIREVIAPGKISSNRYLEIHKIAHSIGLPSNITMLFGHIEELSDIVAHLCTVRDLQDETGGFGCFVPLKYHTENNALSKSCHKLKPKDINRIYAVSRLMLDNIDHLKVLWNYVGEKEAIEALSHGANDFGSAALEEKVSGADKTLTYDTVSELIRALGRKPRHVHSGKNRCSNRL